ncbi:MAG: PAS domain-containing protein [Parvibaculum sp.]|nr:PAS domain-containing protein [Parvibaculum sp.]
MPELLRLSPFDLYVDPLLNLQDARLRGLLTYWTGKREGRSMPSRADLNPGEMVSHLPTVFLIDVMQPAVQPSHFQVRLMGTALNDLFSADYTGETLDRGMSGKGGIALSKVLGIVCQLHRPLRMHGVLPHRQSKTHTEIEAIIMPLSTDGTNVEMAFGEIIKRASV